jgi:hypothetical protein
MRMGKIAGLAVECSCFKLLNSFEIKLSFPSLNFFPIKVLQISIPYNNTGFTVTLK